MADGEGGACRCREFREQLEAAERRLAAAEAEIQRLRRLNAIADQYNDDLRGQLDALNAQLHDARRRRPTGTTDSCPEEEKEEDQRQEEAKYFKDAATEYEDQQNCEEAQVVSHVTSDGLYTTDTTGFLRPDPQILDPIASLEISETRTESMQSLMNEIKETAEAAVAQSNFIFDPRTGMYYDSQSGYYYDAEKSLYYEPYSGCYYYYNCKSQAYEFRSQVDYSKYSTLSHIIFNQGKNDADEAESGQRAATTQPRKKMLRRKRKSEQLNVSYANDASSANETDANRDKELKHFRKKHKAKIADKVSHLSVDSANQKKSPAGSPVTKATADDLDDDQVLPMKREAGEERQRTSESESNRSSSESELEDGELSSSFTSDVGDYLSCTEDGIGLPQTGNAPVNPTFEVLRCTPCLRIVVRISDCLPIGKLYIVTCTSVATIGRDETLSHAILIPDPLISKMHCDIKYDDDLKRYVVRDHATQCGTFVNGKRLSETKTMSDPCPLYNGDNIRLSGTTLDVHIHPGSNTCMDCEPGNFVTPTTHSEKKPTLMDNRVLSKEERETERRRQLKAIRKKYGLEKMIYETDGSSSSLDRNCRYQDRAAERRATHGSDNPHQKDDLPSSVFRPIASENKGHRLLSKMGWKDGQSLGKSEQGIKEPIQVSLRVEQSAGLGSDANMSVSADDVVSIHSSQKWIKARQRYNRISSAENHNSGPQFTRKSKSENGEVK